MYYILYGADSTTADDLESVGVDSPCGIESRLPYLAQDVGGDSCEKPEWCSCGSLG